MSSTNKTTNYQLSQFIGTDKPAWLSDYNGDMGKIDTGIHNAQSAATAADGKATANTSAIGTLSSLTTTAKTNLVSAINEVNTTAGTAVNTASTAAGNASQAKNEADALAAYLTMSSISQVGSDKYVPSAGTVNTGKSSVTVSTNSTASLGKVYGSIRFTAPTAETAYTITLNIDSGIHPDADFSITPAGLGFEITASSVGLQYGKIITLVFKPNGNIQINFYCDRAGDHMLNLWPCLYFFKDFGDVEPTA